ncbi:uncharacterized protein KZ484_018173 isoform 2-T2 [Pholidichthys leucotaenia]
MFNENEEKAMKAPGVCSGGFSCWQMFEPSDRVKRQGSHVRCLCWLQTHLLVVFLLAGHASCQTSTATTSLPLSTTTAQTSVHYFVEVIVEVNEETKNESEIIAWLDHILQTNSKSCLSSVLEETTASPTSPQTTPAETSSETTTLAMLSTSVVTTHSTTAASTVTAAKDNTTTDLLTSTTVISDTTTTAGLSTQLQFSSTTIDSTITPSKESTTTPSTPTTLISSSTTAEQEATLQSTTTTAVPTSTKTTATTSPTTTAVPTSTETTATASTTTAVTTSPETTATTSPTTTAVPTSTKTTATTSPTTTAVTTSTETTATTSPTTTAVTTSPETTATTSPTTTAVTTSTETTATTSPTTTAVTTSPETTATTSPTTTAVPTSTKTTATTSPTTTAVTTSTETTATTSPTATAVPTSTKTTATASSTTTAVTTSTETTATTSSTTTAVPASTSLVTRSMTTTAQQSSAVLPGSTTATPILTTVTRSSATTTAPAASTSLISTSTITATEATLQGPTTAATSTSAMFDGWSTASTRNTAPTPAKTTATTNPTTTAAITQISQTTGVRGRIRVAREIGESEVQSRETIISQTTGLFQGMEVSCANKMEINNTQCYVTLRLSQEVHPCCILQTLCAVSNVSSNISVVGRRADRLDPLHNQCTGVSGEESSCIYTEEDTTQCNMSAYVVPENNNCDVGGNSNCSCSAYCSRSDAYYTFDLSLQDPMKLSNVTFLLSQLSQAPPCSSSTEDCLLSTVAAQYKGANVTCERSTSNLQTCRVILAFAQSLPICSVATAVMTVFQSETWILYDGLVIQAAICGNFEIDDDPLHSQFTWVNIDIWPVNFCIEITNSSILPCQNGENVVVQLKRQCNANNYSVTTSPNVTTTAQQDGLNATTAQQDRLNATTAQQDRLNATTAQQDGQNTTTAQEGELNTTTAQQDGQNTTTAQQDGQNTTTPNSTEDLNPTTTASNVTVTTPGANSSSTSHTVTVTTSEGPATTASAEGQAGALLELTRNVSQLNSSQVNQLVSQLESLLSGPNVSLGLGNLTVNIVSNLLDASPEVLSESSNRIIRIADTVGLKLIIEDRETLISEQLALCVKSADGTSFQETSFSISDPSNVQVCGNSKMRRSVRMESSLPQGSVLLPSSLTQNLTAEEQQLVSRVQFNFYQIDTVFQDVSLGQRRLNSGIVGASVSNLSIMNLQDNVIITLRHTEPRPANFVSTCVFWNFTLNNQSGGWDQDGCFVLNSTDNETICSCNHLTSFAILLDLSREPITSRVQATILTFITYIGCGVSAIFLAVTILTYLAFGKLRKDIPSKILIQLCVALLLLNLVFLVDAWLALYPDAVGLCISTAWFLHYFLLVAFTWMGLEAVHMYLALVKVFNSYISHYMLKFSLVGWGIPMLVVIIVIAINKDNYGLVTYGRFTDGTTDDFCWLKNDIAFYVAVVAYFGVIFLFNCVMFIIVLVQLCQIKKHNPHNVQHRTTFKDVRSVVGLTILLGLTWGFAFFAWGPVNLPFMYLFAIFNSLQGFFIFVFHCAVKESVRKQWRTYLCCGRMRLAENSDWSRTATQKNGKKQSLTNLTSQPSVSSNDKNSSSSSSFLEALLTTEQ